MKRDSFVFYASDYQSIKDMPNEQLGRFFRAICEFALYGTDTIDDKELVYAFKLLIDKIKRDQEKYDEICKKRSEYASRARKKHMLAYATDSKDEYESENGSEGENEIFKIKNIFFFEKRICPVNQQFEIFWKYYCKRQWLDDDGVPIKDKISCAKAWIPRKESQTLCNEYVAALKAMYTRLEREPASKLIVTDLYNIIPRNGTLELYGSEELHSFLQVNYHAIKDILPTAFNCQSITYHSKK
ncbi:MAG: hypothetical protein J6U13_00695 [Salinivirgaceae bacterium]|nr:hypothetical protein [Salinivirgaceae bacterium]MBP5668218.1 hypothetical protein [Salinivirgaceae bacterium]